MKTIYKYEFETKDLFRVQMPRGAKIISVQTQNGTPCMWAIVDPSEYKTERIFTYYTELDTLSQLVLAHM